ncbi:MAG TPA: hypothetical protein PK252_08675 [Bacteroidales bacterium]|mgnify:CR=1 FL=1|nr:hypothetical protein [Bacteroidales bacterium]
MEYLSVKKLFKSNLCSTFVLMLLAFIFIGLWSCEKEDSPNNNYSEYLQLDSYELSSMTEKDMKIMGKALERLNIEYTNGVYFVKQKSGSEVNISDELFTFIKNSFDYSNKLFKPNSVIYKKVRVKSGSPEGGKTEKDTTNCVAIAIAKMANLSSDSVIAICKRLFGNDGVPSDSIDYVVKYICPTAQKSTKYTPGFTNYDFIWFKTGPDSGHAVNATRNFENGYIFFYDGQNKQNGIISSDRVETRYSIPK